MSPTGGSRAQKGVCIVLSSDESDDSWDNDPDYVPTRPRRGNYSGSSRTTHTAGKSSSGNCPRRRSSHNQRRANDIVGKGKVTSDSPQTCEDQQSRRINPGPSSSKLQSTPEKRTIPSWLIDCDMLNESEKVIYAAGAYGSALAIEAKVVKEGLRRKCSNFLTPREFEADATGISSNRPYDFIVVPFGKSLLSCQERAWNSVEERQRQIFNAIGAPGLKDYNGFVCLICCDVGDLMCCENCPSTYHWKCMGMKELPPGNWLCPYCVCKYCGGGEEELIKCSQCDKQYHMNCYVKEREINLNGKAGAFYCSSGCTQISDALQELVGVKNQLEDGFSWTLLHRVDLDDGSSKEEKYFKVECNSKVAVSYQVMNECFMKNIDRNAGVDIVESVTYSRESNFVRFNFKEFYTAILEKKDKIISVASIRLHGTELAEMPFIATLHHFRQKGMAKMLFVALESALINMGIKHLVIPSVPELVEFWKSKFGFRSIDQDVMKKLVNLSTLTFSRTVRLQKSLLSSHQSSSAAEPSSSTFFSAATNGSKIGANATMPVLFDLNLEPPMMPALFDLNLEPPEEDEEEPAEPAEPANFVI